MKTLSLFAAIFMIVIGLSATSVYADEPGCNPEVKQAEKDYSDAQRVKNRAYDRQTVFRPDTTLGLMCFDQAMGLTGSLGGMFADIVPKLNLPANAFSFDLSFSDPYAIVNTAMNILTILSGGAIASLAGDFNIKIPDIGELACAPNSLKMTAGTGLALSLPCHKKTTLASRMDTTLSGPLSNQQNQFRGSLSQSNLSTSAISSWLGSTMSAAFDPAAYLQCFDFGNIATSLMNAVLSFAYPYIPLTDLLQTVMAILRDFLNLGTLKDVFCNADGTIDNMMTKLNNLVNALTDVKCRKISAAWKGGGGVSITGGGTGRGAPLLRVNDFLTGNAAGGGARFTDEITGRPGGTSGQAIKAAHDFMSNEIGAAGGALKKGSSRFLNYPMTPPFQIKSKAGARYPSSAADLISKIRADDPPPPGP